MKVYFHDSKDYCNINNQINLYVSLNNSNSLTGSAKYESHKDIITFLELNLIKKHLGDLNV